MFKIVHQIDKVEPGKFFTFAANQHHHATRSAVTLINEVQVPATNVVPQNSRLALRRNFFTNRVVKNWNSLPANLKVKMSLNSFKS